MSFQVPQFSSSPPATPDRKSNNGNNGLFGASNPSTTPAGPPPSSTGSFTPAGPPPSSFLGSSMADSGSPLKPLSFSQQSPFGFKSSPSAGFMQSPAPGLASQLSQGYQTSPQRPFESEENEDGEYEDDLGDLEEDHRGYNHDRNYEDEDADAMIDGDGSYDEDEEMDDYQSEVPGSRTNGRGYDQHSNSDLLLSTPGALRQSQGRGLLELKESLSARPKPSMFESIAKTLFTQMGLPPLYEDDDLILNTEAIIERLYEEGIGSADDQDKLQAALAVIPGELANLWEDYFGKTTVYDSEEYTATIGPGPKASNFAKANFLANLALRIHHPDRESVSFGSTLKTLPLIMLEWMDEYHNPMPSQFEEVQAHRPSPSAHPIFWDTIYDGLLRGKIVAVINTLKDAGWRYCRNSTDDIREGQVGFTGVALANVEKVMDAAIHVLSQCPAAKGDWHTRGSDWTLFRLRISQALEDLKSFNEGRDTGRPDFSRTSTSRQSGAFSRTAQKAESQVPWNIYQSLETLYNLLIGDRNAIIETATDWAQATIGLLVWWDDGKDDRRLAVKQSQNSYRAASRESDAEMYMRKLRKSFEVSVNNTDFEVNSADEVEVGLASLFEQDNEAVIGFLRGWSGPLSSAVAEVASLAGWLPRAEEKSLINMGSLDEEDMDLLGLNSSPSKADGIKDQTLITYTRALSKRGQLITTATGILEAATTYRITREGWELAIAILGRLDSTARSEEMIEDFLKNFPLDSSPTIDKLWRLLNDLGMNRQAESVAESYADLLAEGSHKYGEALWYYALSHKIQRVKDVLDLLISYSLIQSTVYPPEAELDDHLRVLISSPKTAVEKMSMMDDEAAELLHRLLSGYATLRKFYVLRDEEVQLTAGEKPQKGAIARKVEAAAALIAVIASSDDNITGGLYDEARGSVVNVDFLLALLGEAMVFVDQQDYTIAVSHIDILLKTIEDLQAVGPRVYSACTEFLQTVIASGQGLKGSSPTDMLRKSTSTTSGTSSFSLVGSSMLASQLKQSMGSSGVLVKGNVKRGWDWRHGISASTKGDDVLRILRLGLAKDLAKAFLMEADDKM